MRPYTYVDELIFKLATWHPLLEPFSMTSIGGPFGPSVGALFSKWKHLKFLRLGDEDNVYGPFVKGEETIDLAAYQSTFVCYLYKEKNASQCSYIVVGLYSGAASVAG